MSFCFLLFSYETYLKCRENYSNACGAGILKNIYSQKAKVFSFIFLHTTRVKRTRKTHALNAQVVTSLQTSCNKSIHKLSTSCVPLLVPSLL